MTMRSPLPTLLACCALLASAQLHPQPPKDHEQDAMALLQRATEAKASGNHAAALDAYTKAADMLAQDPAQQDGWGLLLQADLQRDLARAALAAGAGDPCSSLDRGMGFLGQARTALAGDDSATMGEAVDGIEQSLKDQREQMRCAPCGPVAPVSKAADVGKPDAALVGHYYLSGVMETGSELRLKPDGRFDWYISYGAVDQLAQGRWGRNGQTVTLVADVPSADRPLVRADEVLPWDEEVERRLRDAEWSRQAGAVAARCPWGAGVVSAPSIYLPEERPPAGAAALARAAGTKQVAESARNAAGRALAKAVAAGASEDDRAAADTAMSDWHGAGNEMEQAHRDAGLPVPDIGTPVLPPECQQPPRDDGARLPPERWRRGVAALVGDPAREMRLSGIDVTFVFIDGRRETAQTNRGGLAFVSSRQGTALEQLVISIPQPGIAPVTLAIAPMAEGVQTVIVDTQQLAGTPFVTMRLTVEGRDLIPEDMPRGRYSRN